MTLGSTTTVPAALGKEFLNFSIIGIIVAYVVILGIVLIRYRKPVFIPPLIFIPLCQITTLIALLGGIGTLDLSTIAGLFGSIGTSVDAQIVVTDSLISKKIENREEAKRRVKKGFYVITRDAFIVIIAIIPLLFANIVEIIGFATAMLIGMVLSVFITTQTYGAIVESMFEDKIK